MWVFLSLVSAFALATSDALTKRTLGKQNEYLVAWCRLLFALPILAPFALFMPIPPLDVAFYSAFALALPLEVLSVILYVKALRLSPLSLTLPFLSLTPLFVIGVSYVVLGEEVSFRGLIGILFLAAGSYVLNLHELRGGLFEPVKAIVREKGSLLMILVALIYSVTSSLGKKAILHSSPLFFGATYVFSLALFLTPIALWNARHHVRQFAEQRSYRELMAPGIFYAIMVASHMIAISAANVAYMISLKRTSVLIGVAYGHLIFRERHIRERLAGAIIMLAGFALVVSAP